MQRIALARVMLPSWKTRALILLACLLTTATTAAILDYFLGLVRRGYSPGMDHVHRGTSPNFKPSFERRAECIKLLVDAGFADKLFLSQDSEFAAAVEGLY